MSLISCQSKENRLVYCVFLFFNLLRMHERMSSEIYSFVPRAARAPMQAVGMQPSRMVSLLTRVVSTVLGAAVHIAFKGFLDRD